MFNKIFDIAASAMSANRLRINTIASNIANAETTKTAEGGPYKRKDVVFAATDLKQDPFADALDEASLKNVRVAAVMEDQNAPQLVYNPGHPDADPTTGMVAMPNINVVTEMVNMISANGAYKAAAEIVNITKDMASAVRRLAERS
jgi:flagellar basal-body rod protein FlgC